MSKLKLWNERPWEEAEKEWEEEAKKAAQEHPLKKLSVLPVMTGITEDTAKNLKWKSAKWMLTQDHDGKILRSFFKHPFKYGWKLFKSLWKKKPYLRDGDFFLYGIQSEQEFQDCIKDPSNLLCVGFSYCHKPIECPSGRFTDACRADLENPVCRQCFIGKTIHAVPKKNTIPLIIPTIHYIGGKIFDLVHQNPGKQIIFIITACEMTLEMFGDWGNMVGIKGIGVRLGGRICNTMKAFELSEKGIKPGLTVVLDETQKRMMDLIRQRRFSIDSCNSTYISRPEAKKF